MPEIFLEKEKSVNYSSLAESAEERLLQTLIELPFYAERNKISVQRLLSSYPGEESDTKKIRVIQKIMNLLWIENSHHAILEVFKNLEQYLRATGKRDHFIHQFEVFLLGWNIINEIIEIDKFNIANGIIKSDEKTNYQLLFGDIKLNKVFEYWLMTSMSHDIGYPIQEAVVFGSALSKLYKNLGFNKLYCFYNKLFHDVNSLIENKPFWLFSRKNNRLKIIKELIKDKGEYVDQLILKGLEKSLGLEMRDANIFRSLLEKPKNIHGYISALLLGRSIIETLKEDPALANAIESILSAIAMHAIKEKEYVKRINFALNPFAYLLFITDNLQEWSREANADNDDPITYLTEYEFEKSKISIQFLLRHDNWPKVVEQTIKNIGKAKELIEATIGIGSGITLEVKYISTNERINKEVISIKL
jgi:hypothetical protein